jgi:hypothetical protein
MASKRPVACGLLAAMVAMGTCVPRAQAQLSSIIYDDVKDVIEELITAEIARSVATNVACRSGHVVLSGTRPRTGVVVIDGARIRLLALQHYPRSLQQLYDRQFGGLRATLLAESANLASFLVYQALDNHLAGLPRATVLPAPTGPAQRSPDGAALEADDGRRIALAYQLQAHKLPGDGPAAPALAQQLERQVFTPLGASCRLAVDVAYQHGIAAAQYPLDEACADVKAPGEALACELAFALRGALVADGSADEHVARAISLAVATALYHGLRDQYDVPQGADELAKVTVIAERVAVIFEGLAASGDLSAMYEVIARGLDDLFRPRVAVAGAVVAATPRREIGFSLEVGPSADGEERAAIVASLAGAPWAKALERVALAWRRSADARGRLAVRLEPGFELLLDRHGPVRAMCAAVPEGACAALATMASIAGRGRRYAGIVRAASQGDVRMVAHAALSTLFRSFRDQAACDHAEQCEKDAYQRFAEAVVAYAVDLAEDRTPTDATRAAFRSAALEVIRDTSPNGFARKRWYGFLVPDFALRASWSSGYLDDDDSTFRSVASVNVITLRPILRYTEMVYMAAHLSALDLLAPVAEVALRPSTFTYEDEARNWANVVNPRIDMALGLPGVSRHLTLTMGVALRLATPVLTSDPALPTRTYRYDWAWDDDETFGRSLEFGLALKYVP